ncbi:hypothetical protein V6N13_141502 [Hibiscus sabdariffa]|uniref:Uncharacterized protein n=1 Tax=Hibiscus sabdariffa TaxID=183260 RepID=A0ABR2BK03_9ROSI
MLEIVLQKHKWVHTQLSCKKKWKGTVRYCCHIISSKFPKLPEISLHDKLLNEDELEAFEDESEILGILPINDLRFLVNTLCQNRIRILRAVTFA